MAFDIPVFYTRRLSNRSIRPWVQPLPPPTNEKENIFLLKLTNIGGGSISSRKKQTKPGKGKECKSW
ncbi:hypothetical protein Q8A67_020250 [Cirrhinus molitorella]|uniref:Uncharacterized protein n=1 Tax=Cirrhinus molitorella TaxID=172907 RepID=A0AA88TDU3_9TELE|nr:hypothetical protein Q8A67_020250 [Cirrhinus molitorella]